MKIKKTNKIKFYDNLLIISLISLVLLFILGFFFLDSEGLLGWSMLLPFAVFIIILSAFSWGMIYHKFKNKKIIWLIIDGLFLFLLSSIGLGSVVVVSCVIFYFVYMRKQFKKGKGVYA